MGTDASDKTQLELREFCKQRLAVIIDGGTDGKNAYSGELDGMPLIEMDNINQNITRLLKAGTIDS